MLWPTQRKLVQESKKYMDQQNRWSKEDGIRDAQESRGLGDVYKRQDYAIPQHVHSLLTDEGKKSVKVLSSDTDVFVLLCYFLSQSWKDKDLYMDSFSSESKVMNINKSVEARQDIIKSLVGLHAISGCDTVPSSLA